MARIISMDILVHEVQHKCQAGKESTFLFQNVASLSLIEHHCPLLNKGADSSGVPMKDRCYVMLISSRKKKNRSE